MIRFWLTGTTAFAILLGAGMLSDARAADPAEAGRSGCAADARIDGSTADDARKKMNAAGYTQVTDLKKGCDNFWHGQAIKDGMPTGVLLAPDGRVQSEARGG